MSQGKKFLLLDEGTFVPTDLLNLGVWWDAAASYMTKDGSDRVSSWANRVAGGVAATGAGSPLPLWQANQVKGQPSVYFAGAQYFTTSAAVAEMIDGQDAPFTVFAVVKRDVPVSVNGHVFAATNAGADGIPLVSLTNVSSNQPWGVYKRGDDNSLKSLASQNTQADGEWCMLVWRHTGTTSELRRNGTSILTAAAQDAATATLARFTIGTALAGASAANSYWTGHIAELGMFTRSLSDGELDQLEAYLASKFFYFHAEHAADFLATDTYDGGDMALHPSVVYKADGWNGFKYWMAMTPYPDLNDEYEDPSILCSNDGTTWSIPAGLTNPIDNGGSSPNHNADPELYWDATYTTLYCFWTHWTNATSTYRIYRMSSADGSTWGSKTEVKSGTGYLYVSPAIVFDGLAYRLYCFDITTSPNTLTFYTCTTLTGTWSPVNTCIISGIPTGRDPWHLSVYKVGATFVGLLTTCTIDVSGTEPRVGVMTSSDGITWTFRGETMFKIGVGWDDGNIYRSTAVPLNANTLDVWYSGWNNEGTPNRAPHIARTTGTLYLTGATETVTSTTPDLVTGLWQWLKADAGITKDGSNLVSAWADQSGGGRNVTQGTAGNKPLWVDAAYGSLPVIRFAGDDFLDGGAIGPASGTNARCIIAVVRNVAPSVNYNHVVHYGAAAAGQAYGLTTHAYTPHTSGAPGPGNHYWGSGMADADACPTHAILTVYFDGTTDRLRVNGIEKVTSTPTLNSVTNGAYKVGCRLNGDELFTGDLCELLVYSAVPSSADMQALEAYLRARWIG